MSHWMVRYIGWHALREEAGTTVPRPRNKDKRTWTIGDTGTLEVFLGMGTFQKHFGMKQAWSNVPQQRLFQRAVVR